jgi:hypothetical protein
MTRGGSLKTSRGLSMVPVWDNRAQIVRPEPRACWTRTDRGTTDLAAPG